MLLESPRSGDALPRCGDTPENTSWIPLRGVRATAIASPSRDIVLKTRLPAPPLLRACEAASGGHARRGPASIRMPALFVLVFCLLDTANAARPSPGLARLAARPTGHPAVSGQLRLRGGLGGGNGDDQDLAVAEADFEAAMMAASAGEDEGSCSGSAPTRGPDCAQRGGEGAETGGSSGNDDFAAALEAATAAETEREGRGGLAASGDGGDCSGGSGGSGEESFAAALAAATAAETDLQRAGHGNRRLDAADSSDSVEGISRRELGKRGRPSRVQDWWSAW